IGALVDLGADATRLEQQLATLGLSGYHLHFSRGQRGSVSGVKFDVHLAHDHEHGDHAEAHLAHTHEHEHGEQHHHGHTHAHHHEHGHSGSHDHVHEHERTFTDIKHLIQASTLSSWVKEKSIAVFHRVAVAEGKIHGVPADRVHFHEVGAVDSIIDI